MSASHPEYLSVQRVGSIKGEKVGRLIDARFPLTANPVHEVLPAEPAPTHPPVVRVARRGRSMESRTRG